MLQSQVSPNHNHKHVVYEPHPDISHNTHPTADSQPNPALALITHPSSPTTHLYNPAHTAMQLCSRWPHVLAARLLACIQLGQHMYFCSCLWVFASLHVSQSDRRQSLTPGPRRAGRPSLHGRRVSPHTHTPLPFRQWHCFFPLQWGFG